MGLGSIRAFIVIQLENIANLRKTFTHMQRASPQV